ncbi:hypothetical protein MRX96_037633 [Rhipicephalus microplus]
MVPYSRAATGRRPSWPGPPPAGPRVHVTRAVASLPIAFIAATAGVSSVLSTVLHKRIPVIVSNLCCCLVCGAALCFPYIMETAPGLALAGILYGKPLTNLKRSEPPIR